MLKEPDEHNNIECKVLPTEIVFKIFQYLPAPDISRCRRVCKQWNDVVCTLCTKDELWRKQGETDFDDVFSTAKMKASAELNCYEIYKSLSLWPLVKRVKESRDELLSSRNVLEEMIDFTVVGDGLIGILTKTGIIYYNLVTKTKTKGIQPQGNYYKYRENDLAVAVYSLVTMLAVILKKVIYGKKTVYTFRKVKDFILVGDCVYYVTLQHDLYVCNFMEDNVKEKLLIQVNVLFMCLSYTDTIHVLTDNQNIYSLEDGQLKFKYSIESPDSIYVLRNLNLLNSLKWHVYIKWLHSHPIKGTPRLDLLEVTVGRAHGDMLILGTKYGNLSLYNMAKPFNLMTDPPIKFWDLTDRYPGSILSILQIDVIETGNGHVIIVGTEKKLLAIKFEHT